MKKFIIPIIAAMFLTACTPAADDSAAVNADTQDTVETIVTTAAEDTTEAIWEDTVLDTADDTEFDTTLIETEEITVPDETTVPVETAEPADPLKTPNAEPEKGYVYLTFDDGPSKYTETVLEILNEYNVPATFFVIGTNAKKQPERLKAIYDAGQVIGCHSMTHVYEEIYKSGESIKDDIARWEAIVSSIIGEVPSEYLYRFPGGSNCTCIDIKDFPMLHTAVNEAGYRAFDWNCGNNDKWFGHKTEQQTVREYFELSLTSTVRLASDPKIILVHETVEETVNMLPWMIEYLRTEGYEFASLAELGEEYLFRS